MLTKDQKDKLLLEMLKERDSDDIYRSALIKLTIELDPPVKVDFFEKTYGDDWIKDLQKNGYKFPWFEYAHRFDGWEINGDLDYFEHEIFILLKGTFDNIPTDLILSLFSQEVLELFKDNNIDILAPQTTEMVRKWKYPMKLPPLEKVIMGSGKYIYTTDNTDS